MRDTTDNDAHIWRAALNSSAYRWPATISLAAVIVILLNLVFDRNSGLSIGPIHLRLSDALFLFTCLLAATLPVWIHVARRTVHGKVRPGVAKQLGASCAWLAAALLLTPHFSIEHRLYDTFSDTNRQDVTTTWVKRSIVESIAAPFVTLDELTWLQSNFSAAYIPARVFCPFRTTRLAPLVGVVRFNYEANALAGGDAQPPAAVLATTIARCERDGAAMLARGLTKESALAKGDIDRFFAIHDQELQASTTSANSEIVLEDSALPKDLLAKIEATLAAPAAQNEMNYLNDLNYADEPGRVRRLQPLVVAVALNRTGDIARLRAAMAAP